MEITVTVAKREFEKKVKKATDLPFNLDADWLGNYTHPLTVAGFHGFLLGIGTGIDFCKEVIAEEVHQ